MWKQNRKKTARLALPALTALAAVGLAGCQTGDQTANEGVNTPEMAASVNGNPEMEGVGTQVEVTMRDNPHAFDPVDIQVPQGQVVVWTNPTDEPHTVTPDSTIVAGGPNSDALLPNGIPKGGTFTWVVPTDAPIQHKYYYHCRFHGKPGDGGHYGTGMVGSATIVDPGKSKTTPTEFRKAQPGTQELEDPRPTNVEPKPGVNMPGGGNEGTAPDTKEKTTS